mmetsp:Transcript_79231/g.132300  ORF Transcript_79231/g.132300 Transcript_79231/m.132300 type:complete len:251 (+) Transcript_79231:666-1418(+)
MLRKGAPSTATCPHEARQATGAGVMTAKLALEELHSMPRVHCSRVQSMMNASQFYSLQQKAAQNFFWGGFRPGEAGKALLPHSTPESSQNWESEQSSATIVPQLSVVADMTRRSGCRERTLSMPPQHPDVGTRQTRPCVHGTAMSHDRMWMIAHTCQQPQMQEYGHKRLETSGKYCTMRLLVWLERPPPVTRGHVKAPMCHSHGVHPQPGHRGQAALNPGDSPGYPCLCRGTGKRCFFPITVSARRRTEK